MSERLPFYKPTEFSGAIDESVNLFIQNYNKASHINGWTLEQKVLFIAVYLQGTASTFLDNFEKSNPIITWTKLENALRLEFETPVEKYMLKNLLQKRKQLPNETITSYINDVEHLCKRIDPMMSQSEMVYTIMKGLKSEITRCIGILDNNNLIDLKRNIKKYESIEFIINNKTEQFPDEIRDQINKEPINTINDNNTKQLEQLYLKMSNLNSLAKNLVSNQNHNNSFVNKSNSNQHRITNQYTKRSGHKYSYKYHFNKNKKTSNSENNRRHKNHYNYLNDQPNSYVNKYNNHSNKSSPANIKVNKILNNNNIEYSHQCKHCYKSNHTSTACRWKLIICNLCNKRCHTSNDCYLINNYLTTNKIKQPNVLNEPIGNQYDSSIPETIINPKYYQPTSINENIKSDIIHTIMYESKKNDESNIIESLKIKNVKIPINSGTTLNYICPDLTNPNLISPLHKYQLSGPDNTPLKILGTATINSQIENIIFPTPARETKNLRNAIMSGNQSLVINKANIDYTKETIIKNNNIKTRLTHNKKPQADKKEKYIIKSGDTIEENNKILNTPHKYSTGQTVSNNFQDKIESFKPSHKFSRTSFPRNMEPTPHKISSINKDHRQIKYIFDNLYNSNKSAKVISRENIATSNMNFINNELIQWETIKNITLKISNKIKINPLSDRCNPNNTTQNIITYITINIKNNYNNRINMSYTNKFYNFQSIKIFYRHNFKENIISFKLFNSYINIILINDSKDKKILTFLNIPYSQEPSILAKYYWNNYQFTSIANDYNFNTYLLYKIKKVYVYNNSEFKPTIIPYRHNNNNTNWNSGSMVNYKSKPDKIVNKTMPIEKKRQCNHELCKVESQTKCMIHTMYFILFIYLIMNTIIKFKNEKLYSYTTLRANYNNIKLEHQIKKLRSLEKYINMLSTKPIHIKPVNDCKIKTIFDSKEPKYKFKFKFKSLKFTETI